jgi:hypothetical protein
MASAPGDAACDELFTVHSAFYGTLDRAAFDEDTIRSRRLVLRLKVKRLTGVMTGQGRRPLTTDA